MSRNFRPEKVSAVMPPFFSSFGGSFLPGFAAAVAEAGFLSASLSCVCWAGTLVTNGRDKRRTNLATDFMKRSNPKVIICFVILRRVHFARYPRAPTIQNRYVYSNPYAERSPTDPGCHSPH